MYRHSLDIGAFTSFLIKLYILLKRATRSEVEATDDQIISPEKDNLMILMKINVLKFTEQMGNYSLSRFHL